MPARRLFGNENTRAVPTQPDWLLRSVEARSAAADAQQQQVAAGNPLPPQPPPFPYPLVYAVNFANAQAEVFVPASGYAVSFWDSTNITDLVQVRFARAQGDTAGPQINFRPGHALGLGDFTWIGLAWAQIAGASGTLLFLPRQVILDENR